MRHAEPPARVVIQPQTTRYWKQRAEEVLFDHPSAVTGWEQQFLQSILQECYVTQYQAESYSASNCNEVRCARMVNNDFKDPDEPQGSDEVSDNYDDVDALDEDMSATDTGAEARQAMHNCIVGRTDAFNAAHVRPRQSRGRWAMGGAA